MKLRAFFLFLLLSLPILADGALYKVQTGRLQATEPAMTVDIQYPLVSGLSSEVDAAFNAQSKTHAHQMAADFEKRARETRAAAPEAAGTEAQSLTLTYETKHLSDRLLAILVSGGEYDGGAHPNPIYYALLVDPKSGAKVPVEKLFVKDSDSLSALSKLSAAALKPRLGELNTDAKWVATGTEPKLENFQVMWPGDDGLHILFPPYQVAPYSSGAPTIVVPYEKLKGLLSDRFFDN